MSKKNKKQLKRDRQISRDKRNKIRNEIRLNVREHRNSSTFHFLFVSKETENLERIYFSIATVDNDKYLINIPVVNYEEIETSNCINGHDFILNVFGIDAKEIGRIEGTNLIVVKDFRVIENKRELVEVIVRPYNEYTWYNSECFTTLDGERIFYGNKLKDYFKIETDLNKLFVYQDTISELVLYKINGKKVSKDDFVAAYLGLTIYSGIELGFRKKGISGMDNRFLIPYDKKLCKILENEEFELKELTCHDEEKKLYKKDE